MTKYLANHELLDLATPNHIRNVVDLLVHAHNLSVESMDTTVFGPMSSFYGANARSIERGRQAGLIAAIAALTGKSYTTIANDIKAGKLQPRHELDESDGAVVVEDDWQPRVVHKPTLTEDEFIDLTSLRPDGA